MYLNSGLMMTIHVNYSTPNGELLVHLNPKPSLIPTNYAGMLFTLINPWYRRINGMILGMKEAGLIRHWDSGALSKMRAKSIESGYIRDIGKESPGKLEI